MASIFPRIEMSRLSHLLAAVCACLISFPGGARAFWPADGRLVAATNPSQPDRAALVADGKGGAIVAWAEATIKAQRVLASGEIDPTWPAGGATVILDVSGSKNYVVATADGVGGAYIAWEDSRGNIPQTFLTRVTVHGTLSPGWPGAGLQVTSRTHYQGLSDPCALAADDSGGVYVVWVQEDSIGASDLNVYATRVLLSGIRAPGWDPEGVPVCRAPNSQFSVAAAPDGQGGLLAAWVDRRAQLLPGVFAQKLDRSGTRAQGWAESGDLGLEGGSSTDPGPPVLAADGTGGAFVAAAGYGSVMHGVIAQRLDAAGVPQWLATGVPAQSPITGFQWDVGGVIPDGSGGMLVAWEEPGAPDKVRRARIDANGQRRWADSLSFIAGAAGVSSPRLVADGSGGAVLAWTDTRSGPGPDVFAQGVDSLGGARWMTGGIPLCAAHAAYAPCMVVTDSMGGALVAWRDNRTAFASQGIYVARVNRSGQTGPTAISVSGLDAAVSDGVVVLRWTAFLDESAEFQVYRAARPEGPYVQVGAPMTARFGEHEMKYVDRDFDPPTGAVRFYKIAWRESGAWEFSGILRVETAESGARLEIVSGNPCRAPVEMAFVMTSAGPAELGIFDTTGKSIRSLLARTLPTGTVRLNWDGRDGWGRNVPAGLYFVRLRAPRGTASRRLLLLP